MPLKRPAVQNRAFTVLGAMIALGTVLTATDDYSILSRAGILPSQVGMALVVIGAPLYIFSRWRQEGRIELGSRWLWIPLAVVAVSIILSGLTNVSTSSLGTMLARVAMGVGLFATFLVVRYEWVRMSKFFFWTVIVCSLGVIAYQALHLGARSGGYIVSESNYNLIVGVMVLGTLLSPLNRQWWLALLASASLFLTGSDEGLFAGAVMAVVAVVRRDWSKKLLVALGVLAVLACICIPIHVTGNLYQPALDKFSNVMALSCESSGEGGQELLTEATGQRMYGNWDLSPIRAFGYGFSVPTRDPADTPHNIILVIVEQVGPAAALAWLVVVGYCLTRRRTRYLAVALLALGVFDHFVWTQLIPWWWIVAGVAAFKDEGDDFVFRASEQGIVSRSTEENTDTW